MAQLVKNPPAMQETWVRSLGWEDPLEKVKATYSSILVGWHHQPDGRGFGWTPGVGDGQGGLACCGTWGRKESDTTERLN